MADDIGALIRHRRRHVGLTQHQAAAKAHISVGGLRDIEQNRVARPREHTLRRLAAALELTGTETTDLVRLIGGASAPAPGLRLSLLGPLAVSVDGLPVTLNSPKQRTLLALLALSANTPVSVDVLVDGMREVVGSVETVRTQISRLRRKLISDQVGPDVLVAAAGGYTLRVDGDQLDLLAFRQRVGEARREREVGCAELAAARYRSALELWRGRALADLPALHVEPVLAQLHREVQAALLEYTDLAARLGRDGDVIALLRRFVDTEPLHEPAHAALITALARHGQRAAAVEVYGTLRRNLSESLGLDPGPAVTTAYLELLDQPDYPIPAPPTVAPPAQLPADLTDFTGRENELRRLDTALAARTDGVGAILVHGLAGVGKSALAVHWAHRVAHRFPDGALYADLDGADPVRVVRGFLLAVGLAPDALPVEPAELFGLYRSTFAHKRVLIVLENAVHARQIETALPASAGCLVLVTSRNQLRGLVAKGVLPVLLDAMPVDDAYALLCRRSDRFRAEPAAAREIAGRCGGLPFALALIAARAATSPRLPIADLAERLRGEAILDLFVTDDSADLRAIFAATLDRLSEDATALFRDLEPGDDGAFDRASVRARFDLSDIRIDRLLDELSTMHLITEVRSQHFTMPRLVRAYAGELRAHDGGGATKAVPMRRSLAAPRGRRAAGGV
ncbi:BTAD domain-containing putative transcriptional regulator [Nocardia takedensis]